MFALIKKDIYDCMTEKTSLLMVVTGVALCVIFRVVVPYKNAEMSRYIAMLCMFFNMAILPLTVFPLMIAQEKEQHTLTVLLRFGVTEKRFILGKAVSTIIIEAVCSLAIFACCGLQTGYMLLSLLLNVLMTVVLLPIGGITAIYAKDKNSVNVYSTCGVLLITIVPMFSTDVIDSLTLFGRLLPTAVFSRVVYPAMEGRSWEAFELWSAIGALVLWAAAAYIVFFGIYKKKGISAE